MHRLVTLLRRSDEHRVGRKRCCAARYSRAKRGATQPPLPGWGADTKKRNATKERRPVERVRAAQQRAWGYGDPATRLLETTNDEARRRFRKTAVSFAPSNDIEFSGERKRVRCNEGLGNRKAGRSERAGDSKAGENR